MSDQHAHGFFFFFFLPSVPCRPTGFESVANKTEVDTQQEILEYMTCLLLQITRKIDSNQL